MNPPDDRFPQQGNIRLVPWDIYPRNGLNPPDLTCLDSCYRQPRDDDYGDFNQENAFVAEKRLPEPRLLDLELPHSELDLTLTFDSILSEGVASTKATTEE